MKGIKTLFSYKRKIKRELHMWFVFLHESFTAKSAIGAVFITVGTLIMVL